MDEGVAAQLIAALEAGLVFPRRRMTPAGLGVRAGTVRANALQLAGLDRRAKRLPRVGTEDWRRYRTARRSAERYITGATETRRPGRLAARFRAARLARARSARAVVRAVIRVSNDERERLIPVAGALAMHLDRALTAYLAGRLGDAADELWAEISDAYGVPDMELVSIERSGFKVWLAGEGEPPGWPGGRR